LSSDNAHSVDVPHRETRFHGRMGESGAPTRSSRHAVLFAIVGLICVAVGVICCYFVFRAVLG